MQFLWNGSTWTTGADDTPSLPIDMPQLSAGQIQRTFYGAARLYVPWTRRRFDLSWSDVGTALVATNLRDMGSLSGTVTIAWSEGTFATYMVPGSLRVTETGYLTWNVSASFEVV